MLRVEEIILKGATSNADYGWDFRKASLEAVWCICCFDIKVIHSTLTLFSQRKPFKNIFSICFYKSEDSSYKNPINWVPHKLSKNFSKNKTETNKAPQGSKITKEPCLHWSEETLSSSPAWDNLNQFSFQGKLSMPELLSICTSAPKGCAFGKRHGLADACTTLMHTGEPKLHTLERIHYSVLVKVFKNSGFSYYLWMMLS